MLVALLATALVSTGCSGGEPAAAPRPPDGPPDVCADVREACSAVVVDQRTHRYQLTDAPAGAAEAGTVVVDLGGPGRALFGNADAAAVAARWPGPERLLFLEEPWVTRPVPEACTRSLSGLYQDVRAEQHPSGGELVASCELARAGRWGWAPDSYRAVVEAIAAEERLDVRGMVGSSYGAPRVAALADLPGMRWLVLNSPAPSGVTAGEYLQVRSGAALGALTDACAGCSPAGGAGTLLAAARADLAARPRTLPDRTPPVVAADVAAAAIGAAYLPVEEREQFVTGLRTLTPDDVGAIGRLSDSTLLRFGAQDVSPALLAYYDEVCRDYTSWPRSAPSGDPLLPLLTRLHAPCAQLTSATTAPRPAAALALLRSCVASSAQDAVTPAAFASTWTRLLRTPVRVTAPGTTHAPLDAMLECVSRVRSA